MNIVIVSKCIRLKKIDGELVAKFYFNGAFDGEKIKGIYAKFSDEKLRPRTGKEYIVHLEVDRVENEIMYSRIERIRDLDEALEDY